MTKISSDKHQGLAMTKNSTHDHDGTILAPLPCSHGGSWVLSPDGTDINTPASRLRLVTTTHMQQPK
jgi:hypothetical protein